MSYTRRSYTTQTSADDSKRKSLLQDGSWIKKDLDEDEPVDRDRNFAKTVLGRYKSSETLEGSEPDAAKSPTSTSPSTSVQALTQRFRGSQDELNQSNTLPGRMTHVRSNWSTLKSDAPKTSTPTSPIKTDNFKDRVFSDVTSSKKGTPYSSYTLPTKSTKVTERTEVKVTGTKTSEDKLFDTLIPWSMKDENTISDSKTSVSKTETVTMKTSMDGDGIKTTTTTTTRTSSTAGDALYNTLPKSKSGVSSPGRDDITTTITTRTASTAEDDLYDSLLPQSIRSPTITTTITKIPFDTVDNSKGDDSPTSTRTIKSVDYTSTQRSYSRPESSYEFTAVTSPTIRSTPSYKDTRAEDSLKDPFVSKSSIRTAHSAPQRAVLEKDLCSYCHKLFTSEAKMVLDDMKINCHASCFKCEVCNRSLSHLKAGDSMWIYRRAVTCENCFEVAREKWRQ